MRSRGKGGWSLLELVLSLAIMGVLISLAVPGLLRSIQGSRAMACFVYRQNIQSAADIYIKTHRLSPGDPLPTISQLIAENLLAGEDHCPAGGIYVWADPIYRGPATPFLISCSLHFFLPQKNGKYLKGTNP